MSTFSRAGAVFLAALLVISVGSYVTAVNAQVTLGKVHPLLLELLDKGAPSQLRTQGDNVYVFVKLRPGFSVQALGDLFIGRFAFGSPSSPSIIYGKVRTNSLLDLASRGAVLAVAPDIPLEFDSVKPDPGVYRERLAADMFRIREIIGADRVNDAGIEGEGIIIAIVDTGTDFAIPDLEDAVARDESGSSISFDPDGQSYAITELIVSRDGDILKTKGQTVEVWDANSFFADEPIPPVAQLIIDVDYGAPAVESMSGNYHFGILRETIEDDIAGEMVTIDFPIVVIDANRSGVYDTVVVDMSTALYNFLTRYRGKLNSAAPDADALELGLAWPEPKAAWNDHSFANEEVHAAKPDKDIISVDLTGDDKADFTAGILANGIDLGGITGKYFALLPPIDPAGNFVNVFFDFQSHGTSTASIAAGRGIVSRELYKNGTKYTLPGIAPQAKVMGVKALWLGDVTFGWYYAAGFDWDPVSFTFTYTGKHRADLISNSWGISGFIHGYGTTFGFDAVSQLANALSLPGYLDPRYPGVTIIASAGNEGFGYGTVDSPASSTLAIIVGATTTYHYRGEPPYKIGNEIGGGYDEVVPWSSRGPTSMGEPKPDVVNVGAFGFADQSSYTGYGDVTKAYLIFGGTSMSCPLTAGTAALVIEEYRKTHGGASPTSDQIKTILASSATDLDYDIFTQGSGRVNAFEAAAAAAEGKDGLFPTRFYVSSTATWKNVRQLVGGVWSQDFRTSVPDTAMGTTNWYAGIVTPGSTTETTLALHNAGTVQAEALRFKLIGQKSFTGKTQGPANAFESWITIDKKDIPADTDLMKVTLIYHFTDFANTARWEAKNIIFAQLYDTDLPKGAMRRITNDAKFSTTSELVVSRPLEKFEGTPKARILNARGDAGVRFDVIVRYYQRIHWNWMTELSVSSNAVNARLTAPADAQPGVYDGLISLTDGEMKTVVPVSVVVPILVSGSYGGSSSDSPYDNYAVFGAFDWAGVYNVGDWRVFALVLQSPVDSISVKLSWADSRTDIQSHLTGPRGYLLASSDYPRTYYEGSGVFKWHTTTGGPADEIAVKNVGSGIYLIVLQNVLLGVSSFDDYPESFTLTVDFG